MQTKDTMPDSDEIPQVATVCDAAEILGVPERTFYSWIEKGVVPVTNISESRVVMTGDQIRSVRAVLSSGGRWAVLDGQAL